MKKKRQYRAIAVKSVQLENVLGELAAGPLHVGLDIAKEEVLVVVRDLSGYFSRPWKAKQPSEIGLLVKCLKQLGAGRSVVVAMESTGTYGDALRQALTDAELPVERVSGKAKSDYEEIFDGVPSAHDGKDAAIIAELAALSKSRPWPFVEQGEHEGKMANTVDWLDAQQGLFQVWLGRLESLLARHWQEATKILPLRSVTLLRALAHYGGPAGLCQDEGADQQLKKWGGPFLSAAKIKRLCESAENTVGVRMTAADQQRMRRYAEEALKAQREIQQAKKELELLTKESETLQREATVVGMATACVLRATVGDPADFHCGEAYRKALGLNLKERSSGKHKGKLKITKRGSSRARRWLYFAAMRLIQKPPVRGWYEAKKKRDKNFGTGAVVAVMRKLALALWNVSVRGEPFESSRLFPGQPTLKPS